MALALVIVALLLYAIDRAQWGGKNLGDAATSGVSTPLIADIHLNAPGAAVKLGLWVALLLTFWQIVLGTQVREQVDMVSAAANYAARETWVAQLGSVFSVHRTVSALVLLVNIYVSYELWQLAQLRLRKLVVSTLAIVGFEILAGIILASFALPATVQPIHLTLATVLFGVQFLTLLAVTRNRKTQESITPSDAARRVIA
jgi:cytochrome c oxidase assembly protein subunit 15